MFGPEYTVIDTDPTASRVVKYMRPSDYALWAGFTGALPALFYAWDKVDWSEATQKHVRRGIKTNALLGFSAGFFLAYQNTSLRFFGWKENAREVEMDKKEMTGRVAKGLPVYGESDLTPFMQGVAARNSTWGVLNLAVMPWLNFVNHPFHGVDTAEKYGEKKSS